MDGLCFKQGVNGFCYSNLPFINGNDPVRTHSTQVSTLGRSGNGVSVENSVVSTSSAQPQKSRFSFTRPLLKSLWLSSNVENREEEEKTEEIDNGGGVERKTGEEENEMNGTSWVMKILHAQSVWKEEELENKNGIDVFERENDQRVDFDDENDCSLCNGDDDEDVCEVDEEDENNEKVEFDKDSFSKLLQKVSLAEAKVLAKISYLGNLAYSIPKIKAENLLKRHKLRFVTSSVEKEAHPANVEDKSGSPHVEETERLAEGMEETEEQRKNRYQISASAAYHIAASAASYLQSHTRGILSFKSSKDGKEEVSIGEGNAEVGSSKAASFVATSDSVTAGVSAKEETKRAVAKDLSSAHSSPCAWFICDDDRSATRFFVIQGSESMASWQANLLFEPVQFEGLDVLVHRGIYEAAKGIYE
ncbi:phospholipase A1 PLIP2, chloroplastic-like [Papaver somniferum]|uniref:phospholipase A1 PLIP2, chloroplastic-like n=1 Tax=Papaver somniferum TaxID=3469 RepID=UPI000E6F81D3|nr:phospholipase A1 PLIP2, chloroplastic-like [Papaver somniferum]